jgi:glycosyltransferase involved in cell wall biosynthesis
MPAPRIALVHDWLTGMRGGERVLDVLCERFPDADLFTLFHVRGSVSPAIERRRIHQSPLQHLPAVRRCYRECLPLFPALVELFNLESFDLVISSSHCAVKSIIAGPRTRHLCYCHTPMRYAWDQFEAYFGSTGSSRFPKSVMRLAMRRMARWDRDTAGRVDRYLTNSQHVADRIRRYYNREAIVVYPPVDTDFFRPDAVPVEPFALVVSALVPYKRIDLAVNACHRARVPLAIVGDGPVRAELERSASGDVRFFGRVSDTDLRDLYRRAAVLLLPGQEDFGIVPLEAQACGRPVVALGRGGALETVVPGETGLLVDEPEVEPFAEAIAAALVRRFDRAVIRRHAERFGRARFGDEIQAIVNRELATS